MTILIYHSNQRESLHFIYPERVVEHLIYAETMVKSPNHQSPYKTNMSSCFCLEICYKEMSADKHSSLLLICLLSLPAHPSHPFQKSHPPFVHRRHQLACPRSYTQMHVEMLVSAPVRSIVMENIHIVVSEHTCGLSYFVWWGVSRCILILSVMHIPYV